MRWHLARKMATGLQSAVLHQPCFVAAVYILESDIHAAALFRRGAPRVTRCATRCSDGWISFAGFSGHDGARCCVHFLFRVPARHLWALLKLWARVMLEKPDAKEEKVWVLSFLIWNVVQGVGLVKLAEFALKGNSWCSVFRQRWSSNSSPF